MQQSRQLVRINRCVLDIQWLGLLRGMLVIRATVHLQLADHGATQRILRQHTLHGQLNDLARRLFLHGFKIRRLEAADKTGVVVIHLVRGLAPGDMHLVSIHHDDVVTGVYMGRIYRFVLSAQSASDFRGQPPQRFAFGINDIPVAVHFMCFCGKCFHQ